MSRQGVLVYSFQFGGGGPTSLLTKMRMRMSVGEEGEESGDKNDTDAGG